MQHLEELLVLLNNQQDSKRRQSSSEGPNDPETLESAGEEEEDLETDFNSDASGNDKAGAPQVGSSTSPHGTKEHVEARPGRWQAVLNDVSRSTNLPLLQRLMFTDI